MKTGDITHSNVPLIQTRSNRGNKMDIKEEQRKQSGGRVNLSTSGPSLSSTPVNSYGQAVNLLKDLDYSKAMFAHNVTREAALQLMGIL